MARQSSMVDGFRKDLDEIFTDAFMGQQRYYEEVVKVIALSDNDPDGKSSEVNGKSTSGVGIFTTRDNELAEFPQDDLTTGYEYEYAIIEYSKEIPVASNAKKDIIPKLNARIEDIMTELGEGAEETIEVKVFDTLFNNNLTLGTGVDLFSESQPIKRAGSGWTSDTTWANYYPTSYSLNQENLGYIEAECMQQRRASGQRYIMVPDKLIVPPRLGKMAREICYGKFDRDNANNQYNEATASMKQKNQRTKGMKPLVIPYLDQQSSYATSDWFLQSKRHGLCLWEREKPTSHVYYQDETDTWRYRMKFRLAIGAKMPQGMTKARGY